MGKVDISVSLQPTEVFLHAPIFLKVYKLDGIGPVDNRPSTDKLHHFVRRKKKKKKITNDT